MKITIANALSSLTLGANVRSPATEDKASNLSLTVHSKNEQSQSAEKSKLSLQPSVDQLPPPAPSTISAPTLSSRAAANLAQKVITALKSKQSPIPANKQLFSGVLPNFFENIIQRIQNYFSVYNPPEYFDGNRPPITAGDEGIAIICSNAENDTAVSCNPSENETEPEAECEETVVEASVPQPEDAGYNIVVTHTVVQDNTVNLYSPVDPLSGQIVSNVVVVLEPSANEYNSPPAQSVTERNKFYVYINPTKTNANKFDTKSVSDSSDKSEPFQPYTNASYTLFISGNKLEEYSNNIENTDNGSLNPDISSIVQGSSGRVKLVKNKCRGEKCGESGMKEPVMDDEAVLNSRLAATLAAADRGQNVPNINLVLVPSDERANKSCNKNKFDNANSTVEYLVLKPDDGSLSRPKNSTGNLFYLQKPKSDAAIPFTYLSPEQQKQDESTSPSQVSTSMTTTLAIGPGGTDRRPLLFNLFKKRAEEPR